MLNITTISSSNNHTIYIDRTNKPLENETTTIKLGYGNYTINYSLATDNLIIIDGTGVLIDQITIKDNAYSISSNSIKQLIKSESGLTKLITIEQQYIRDCRRKKEKLNTINKITDGLYIG